MIYKLASQTMSVGMKGFEENQATLKNGFLPKLEILVMFAVQCLKMSSSLFSLFSFVSLC